MEGGESFWLQSVPSAVRAAVPFLFVLSNAKAVPKAGEQKKPKAAAPSASITEEELAKHPGWVAIRGRVYDVSAFDHPGGEVIKTYGGKEATEVFTSFHSEKAWGLLGGLCIGTLARSSPKPSPGTEKAASEAMLEDFRALRAQFKREGLFESSKAFYLWKLSQTLGLLATAGGLLLAAQASWLALLSLSFIVGLFFQQSGWLAHDFLHHQVFKERLLNNLAGLYLGPFSQGLSVSWWKAKHNVHHAAPNQLEEGGGGGSVDPDIDTLPFLAWSPDMLHAATGVQKEVIRHQQYYFLPLLAFARVSWVQTSAAHILGACKGSLYGYCEVLFLCVHAALFFALPLATLPLGKALAYLALSQAVGGYLLGLVFVQSHNGMEVSEHSVNFVHAQIVTTRNICTAEPGSVWVNWLMGGLNYQIEHHIFPGMPRSNLARAAPGVKRLAEKHGLAYQDCSPAEALESVFSTLAEVASQCRA